MKKQPFLAGAIAAIFLLCAAGTVSAGDRRGSHRGPSHWSGKHFTAKPHSGYWKRGFAPHHNRGWSNGRRNMPRHRLQHRIPNHHPGFRAPRHPYGQHRSDRPGRYQRPSNHYRPDRSGHRPSAGYDRTGQNDGGQDQSGSWQSDGAVTSDDGISPQRRRHSGGRQDRL
jgi:hypothetical protein